MLKLLPVIEGLGRIQATYEEAAAVIGLPLSTFSDFKAREPKVSEAFDRGRLVGLSSLRRAQYANAVERMNPTMQIWLGKQYLGQKDQIEQRFGEIKEQPLKYRLTDDELMRIAAAGHESSGGVNGDSKT
ncbi:MAG: hypothetical protein ACRESI_06570 [Gammaproteobacteria bacterium]